MVFCIIQIKDFIIIFNSNKIFCTVKVNYLLDGQFAIVYLQMSTSVCKLIHWSSRQCTCTNCVLILSFRPLQSKKFLGMNFFKVILWSSNTMFFVQGTISKEYPPIIIGFHKEVPTLGLCDVDWYVCIVMNCLANSINMIFVGGIQWQYIQLTFGILARVSYQTNWWQ